MNCLGCGRLRRRAGLEGHRRVRIGRIEADYRRPPPIQSMKRSIPAQANSPQRAPIHCGSIVEPFERRLALRNFARVRKPPRAKGLKLSEELANLSAIENDLNIGAPF